MKPKINISYVCSLANLRLTEEEKTRLIPQMEKIVKWVSKLEELEFDVSKSEVYSPLSFTLPFRKDEVLPSFSSDQALVNSPEKSKGFIKVPKVIEEK